MKRERIKIMGSYAGSWREPSQRAPETDRLLSNACWMVTHWGRRDPKQFIRMEWWR